MKLLGVMKVSAIKKVHDKKNVDDVGGVINHALTKQLIYAIPRI